MKSSILKNRFSILFAGLVLAASTGVSSATEIILNQFNSAAEVSAFAYNNWNGSPGNVTFDATKDANGNPASGSMKMQITYQAGGSNGCAFISSAAPMPVRLANVSAVEFDLMVDAASPLDKNGNAFYFQIGFNSPSFSKYSEFWLGPWGQNFTPGVWKHFSNSVPVGTFSSTNFLGQLFMNPYDDQYTNAKTPIVYIDNIQFHQDTYPDFVGFTFDNDNFLGGTYTTWYGTQPTTITFSTNDFYGSTNSGSAYITSPLGPSENDSVFVMAFDTNWNLTPFPAAGADTNVIDGFHYDGVQLDVMWDTNNSTMDLSLFNLRGDIAGIPFGVFDGGGNEAFGSAAPNIPNGASNGWVRMFLPLNKNLISAPIQGLFSKKYGNGPVSGAGAYWIDNVTFLGSVTTVFQPTLTISKPVRGLNLVSTGRSGNNPYDREDLETFTGDYTFVDQPNPVTYSIGIADFPAASIGNYRAWIVLSPTPPINAFPDYAEATVMLLVLQRDAAGSQVILQCKTNASNGNGSLALSNSTWIVNSPIEGNWSFTFTHNTNILVHAPNGSSTNLVFPLGFTASDVTTWFGSSMYALFGGFNNGVGIGQRVVLSSAAITNGANTLIHDNFLTDTQINTTDVGGPWIVASYATTPAEAVFLTAPTTKYHIDWTVPANGFVLQTNAVVNNAAGWSTNGDVIVSQLGDHMHAALDETNLPPAGSLYFRVKKP